MVSSCAPEYTIPEAYIPTDTSNKWYRVYITGTLRINRHLRCVEIAVEHKFLVSHQLEVSKSKLVEVAPKGRVDSWPLSINYDRIALWPM